MAHEVKWIKITTDIFDDEKFDAIETLADKQMIQLAWIKLLCLAGRCNNNGFLTISNEIPYTNEMLANRFKMSIGDVQRALQFFQDLGMVEVVNDVYMVSNWLYHQNGDKLEVLKEQNKNRQKRFRERQKTECLENKNSNVTDNVTHNVTHNVTNNVTSLISNSYSFNNTNSNLDNYINLINNNIYNNSEYILNNNKLNNSIKEWMEYKDERKPKSKHYYATEKGMKKLLTEIINKDKEFGTDAVVDAIDKTMAAQYDGIGWYFIKEKPTESEWSKY